MGLKDLELIGCTGLFPECARSPQDEGGVLELVAWIRGEDVNQRLQVLPEVIIQVLY